MNIPLEKLSSNSTFPVELPEINPKFTDLIDPHDLHLYYDEFKTTLRKVLLALPPRTQIVSEWIYHRFATEWNNIHSLSLRIPPSITQDRNGRRNSPEYLWTEHGMYRDMEVIWPQFGIEFTAFCAEVRQNRGDAGIPKLSKRRSEGKSLVHQELVGVVSDTSSSVQGILENAKKPKRKITKAHWNSFRGFCEKMPGFDRRFFPGNTLIDSDWEINCISYEHFLAEYSPQVIAKYFEFYSKRMKEYVLSISSKGV